MIFTLGVNVVLRGLMVMLTGGFSPSSQPTETMMMLAKDTVLGLPNPVIIWAIVGILVAFLLRRTALGRYIYATGNREAAVYLSGIDTRLVLVATFALCSLLASVAGLLLAGYSSKAFQAMGDPYLLPAIAAVVIGGTNILGGSGRYSGTVAGVLLIVLLQSVLSVMQMPEAGRQIIYGVVIVAMLLAYGRSALMRL
jgi:ribose transport system permease protein